MVVDSSAILAILLDEPEAHRFLQTLLEANSKLVSAGTLVELAAVSTRRFAGNLNAPLDHLLASVALETAPVTSQQATIAMQAYRRYGIGTGHPAHLNFGDCFSYALAKATGEPLLFKGNDFTHTDIVAALR